MGEREKQHPFGQKWKIFSSQQRALHQNQALLGVRGHFQEMDISVHLQIERVRDFCFISGYDIDF